MNFKKYLFGALSLLTLSACSNEDAPAAPDAGQNGDTYATISLSFATGSRSTTITPPNENTNSSDGFEYGQNEENTITNLTVILATKDEVSGKYTIGAVSNSAADLTAVTTGSTKTYTVLFQNNDLLELATKKVYIFAICNSNKQFVKTTDLMDAVESLSNEVDAPWTPGKFLMANAPRTNQTIIVDGEPLPLTVPFVTLPGKTTLFKEYNTPDKAFKLGEVRVARVVARFDFKQINNNIYPVYDVNSEKDENGKHSDEDMIAKVKLLAMAPVNIAKEFYYLPRVSADGTDRNWEICGQETPSNWVVSPNYAQKNGSAGSKIPESLYGVYQYQTPLATHVNYSDESYFSYTYLDKFNGKDDDDANWGTDGVGIPGYKIWRYVTENTLTAKEAQKKAISTGVVFKAEIIDPKEGSNLAKAMNAGDIVYGYDGIYYGNLAAMRDAAANQTAASTFRKKFMEVFGAESLNKDEQGNYTVSIDEEKANNIDSEQEQNTTVKRGVFKILRPTKDTDGKAHYYVYYLYRNRHNDNGDNGIMGAMEFATVRNNVYKLSVTSISDFGHTDNPGDDPDPEDPDDPDEEEKVYFKVACRVVPWMVRINSIEF